MRTPEPPTARAGATETASKAARLRDAFASGRLVRVAGVVDGVTAQLAERCGFDAAWCSSLATSAQYAVPDASILTMTELLAAAATVERAASLPVIADCDTGFGDVNNLVRAVLDYERAGIAAICVEDKEFPKRNSFTTGNRLCSPTEFAAKIAAATHVRTEVVVIARLESLIAGETVADLVHRAECYADAGADALLVHSKARTVAQLFEAVRAVRRCGVRLPIGAVPTTYPDVTGAQLHDAGVDFVIYANQALRATISAVERVFRAILQDDTTARVEASIASVRDVLDLLASDRVSGWDEWAAEAATAFASRYGGDSRCG